MLFRSLVLLQLLLIAACGSPTDTSWSRAANATYEGIVEQPITLVDGSWRGAPYAEGGSSRPAVQLLETPSASADFDGDGVSELIVVLVANFGGSGSYHYIAIVDSLDDASYSIGTAIVGDRVAIESVEAVDSGIVAQTIEHAADDPMCCPSLNRSRQWTLEDDVLEEVSRDAAMRTLRGHATIGHEVRSFVECETAREGWILDGTQGDLAGVYESLAGEQYQPVFVEVTGTWRNPPETGFGADFEEAVAIDSVIRAEREGFGCLDEPATYSVRATGNEPSWRLDISGPDISVTRMSGDGIESTVSSVRDENGLLTVIADGVTIRLEKARCTDSMSGSIFAWTAEVEIGSDVMTGCGMRGRVPLDEVERQSDRQPQ